MAVDPLVERDQIVCDLRDALRDTTSGLAYAPRLIRKVLETEAWRERYDRATHRPVPFSTFRQFVETEPTEGLGASLELIDRIVGTKDADLLRLLRAAKKGKPGRKTKGVDSTPIGKGEDAALTADRLAREAPNEYAAVARGEKTINAAAVAAGIRAHRVSVRVDRPESIAASLRKYMTNDDIARLIALLMRDGEGV